VYIPVYKPISHDAVSEHSRKNYSPGDDEIMLRDLLAELLEIQWI